MATAETSQKTPVAARTGEQFLEGLRGDEGVYLAGLTMSQGISVVVFLGGVGTWLYLARLPLGRYADGLAEAAPAGERPALVLRRSA